MRLVVALSLIAAIVIGSAWAWLGRPVAMPGAQAGPADTLYCVSYAPFRGRQTPFDPTTQIPVAQVEQDIAQLAKLTDCVRTYSVDFTLEHVPEIASRHGMSVIMGLWLSQDPVKNRSQIATAINLANQYRSTVRAVVVGNEVLLRGDMSASDLAAAIAEVKAKVPVPVTYADVWEFWLRNKSLADITDFVTIHILPYWEDDPIPAQDAAAHVSSIHRHVVEAFPGKEIMIGEFGWPSAGRMREGALPSPANQARVIQDVLALAKREHFRLNVIEAFDQPWKRALEGTVGGHWGLLDAATREFKFAWGAPVSSHPYWAWQALGGIAFSGAIFFAAWRTRRRDEALATWLPVGAIAVVSGVTIGWGIENAADESLGAAGAIRSSVLLAAALLTPPLTAAALMSRRAAPQFAQMLTEGAAPDRISRALGWLLIAVTILTITLALGLVFDPRYRDFAFAPLSGAIVPLFILAVTDGRPRPRRGAAELVAAAVLVLCAAFIGWNETPANWQALWCCGLLLLLALTLAQGRGARS